MKCLSFAACLLLAGCASSGTGAIGMSSQPSFTPVETRDAGAGRGNAEIEISGEFEINEFAAGEETVVCRREAPLGSRISVERCHAAETRDARNAALDQIQRQELEEMRQRQMYQDQQRRASEMAQRRIPIQSRP